MRDEHSQLDNESQTLLQELGAKPVSRRWMLKAGLSSAAAMAVHLQSAPVVAAPKGPGRFSSSTLHWRSIFAANYSPLTDLGTSNPHIDPALGVAEPSLSRFDPITPSGAPRLRR
jgi:hypothetical protein